MIHEDLLAYFKRIDSVYTRISRARVQLLKNFEKEHVFADDYVRTEAQKRIPEEELKNNPAATEEFIKKRGAPACLGLLSSLSCVNEFSRAVEREDLIGDGYFKSHFVFREEPIKGKYEQFNFGLKDIEPLYIPIMEESQINQIRDLIVIFMPALLGIGNNPLLFTAFPYHVDDEESFGETNFDFEARYVEILVDLWDASRWDNFCGCVDSNTIDELIKKIERLFDSWIEVRDDTTEVFGDLGFYFSPKTMKNVQKNIRALSKNFSQRTQHCEEFRGFPAIGRACTLFTSTVVSACYTYFEALKTCDEHRLVDKKMKKRQDDMKQYLQIAIKNGIYDTINYIMPNMDSYLSESNGFYDLVQIVGMLTMAYVQKLIPENVKDLLPGEVESATNDLSGFELFTGLLIGTVDRLLKSGKLLEPWDLEIWKEKPSEGKSTSKWPYISILPHALRSLSILGLVRIDEVIEISKVKSIEPIEAITKDSFLGMLTEWTGALSDKLLEQGLCPEEKDFNYLWTFEEDKFELAYTAYAMDALTQYLIFAIKYARILSPKGRPPEPSAPLEPPEEELIKQYREFKQAFEKLAASLVPPGTDRINRDKLKELEERLQTLESDLEKRIATIERNNLLFDALFHLFGDLEFSVLAQRDIKVSTLNKIGVELNKALNTVGYNRDAAFLKSEAQPFFAKLRRLTQEIRNTPTGGSANAQILMELSEPSEQTPLLTNDHPSTDATEKS